MGRYLEPDPIRLDGAFHRYATRRVDDGSACVVVVAAPGVDRDLAREALAPFARAHAASEHPMVPRASEVLDHEGTPFVELASNATIDGLELVTRFIAHRHRIAYAEADALLDALFELLARAPAPVGRLSLASLLAAPDGGLFLVGLGHAVAIDDPSGDIAITHAVHQAPEVALGGPRTSGGDFVAAWLLWRALVPHVDVPETLARALRGESGDDERVVAETLRELDERLALAPLGARASYADLCASRARIRTTLSVTPDPEGLARTIADVVLGLPLDGSSGVEGMDEPTEESVALGPHAAWIDTGRGERLKLGPSLRNILALLLAQHLREPARTLSTWDLLEAGWPGEKIAAQSGANRVYAAINRLRNMGLRSTLERHDDGYRIVPGARLTLIEE